MMMKVNLAALLLATCISVGATPKITSLKTAAGDEYSFITQPKPGPLAIIFTSTIVGSLGGEFTSIGDSLAKAGFIVASVDIPCHGVDASAHTDGLRCWAKRVSEAKGDYFAPFLQRVKRVVTDMRYRKLVTGERMVAVGVSRGGYLALRASAIDDRITDVIGLAPVTELQRLDEFSGVKVKDGIYGLKKYAAILAKRHVFLQIGSADGRVGTRQVIALVDAITAAADGSPLDLTFVISPSPGHVTAEHTRAAQWAIDEFNGADQKYGGSPPPPK